MHRDRTGAPAAPLTYAHPVAPEDRERSDFYALLARLFAEAPDRALLGTIAAAPRMDASAGGIADAWNRLVDASAAMDAEAAMQEYTDLFIGVGKCEVNLHGSHWITGYMMERPLAELRAGLAELGIARRDDVVMLEDHLSALYETMRLLIAGDGASRPASTAAQRAFFARHLEPWAFSCCTAIAQSPIANYYVRVAEFAGQYMALDRDALAME